MHPALQLGRVPEDVLAIITGKLLQGLVFMHAKHMVSGSHMGLLRPDEPSAGQMVWVASSGGVVVRGA